MQTKILVVDDEEAMCMILKINLEADGYSVSTAQSVDEALTYDLPSYSMIILDIIMDRISGFDFAKRLKHSNDTENIPIIFCSALNGENERIMGLNIGADDYIVKPFKIGEFLARVRSVLRRADITKVLRNKIIEGSYLPDINIKDLRVNRNTRTVYIKGENCKATKTEYELLLYLINHPNTIHSRESLMEKVWQKDITSLRTIDTTITRLRKKMGICEEMIITRAGYGYGIKEKD
ncbi:MAG: response regulator transcription factor [Muribaculaceae bacterium]|nr:response regulator transcription factor [Muribaculaceae bacterium]